MQSGSLKPGPASIRADAFGMVKHLVLNTLSGRFVEPVYNSTQTIETVGLLIRSPSRNTGVVTNRNFSYTHVSSALLCDIR